MNCPTCGSPIAHDAPLRVDLNACVAVANGKSMKFERSRALEILHVLALNHDRPIARDALFLKVWGQYSEHDKHIVNAKVFQLRKKIKRLGLDIESVNRSGDRGYRLVNMETEA